VIAHRFHSMGCDIVVASPRSAEVAAAERLFAEWEQTFSRFRADSELSRVNASAGAPTLVSALFARAVRTALDAAAETDGLVDPTLGRALEEAGYDDHFDRLRPQAAPAGDGAPGAWRSLTCYGQLVSFPRGIRLDLNGVVKGMAVDSALALMRHGWFVSAGGDVAVREPLGVQLPGGGTVELRSGALATSGSVKRRWLRGGEVQHHLIDPRSGRPAVVPWQQVTVCGATCVAADVAAKAAFLAGERGPDWLDTRRLPGRFVDHEGQVVVNQSWRESMAETVACT
jgi:FAD:protein FMN transferase